MKVERLDHVHIGVHDLDGGIGRILDLFDTSFCEALVSEPKEDVRASVCDLGSVGLELFTGQALDGPITKLLETRGEGCYGISVKVPDIDEAIADVRAQGLRIVRVTPAGGAVEAHIHPRDTYGVMVELCQYKWQHPALIQALKKGCGEYQPAAPEATVGGAKRGERPRLNVERISHVYVGVRDLDRAAAFFSRLFDTSFSEIIRTDPELDTKATGCNLGGVGFVLFSGLSPNGWVSRLMEKRNEGCYGFSFKVRDLEEAVAAVKTRGLRIVRKARIGDFAAAHIHPKDTFGVLFELCQYDTKNAGVVQLLEMGHSEYQPEK